MMPDKEYPVTSEPFFSHSALPNHLRVFGNIGPEMMTQKLSSTGVGGSQVVVGTSLIRKGTKSRERIFLVTKQTTIVYS